MRGTVGVAAAGAVAATTVGVCEDEVGVYDVAIVGGGIVGLATAREVQGRFPHMKVVVLEKEADVSLHQSGYVSMPACRAMFYVPRLRRPDLLTMPLSHALPNPIHGLGTTLVLSTLVSTMRRVPQWPSAAFEALHTCMSTAK
jgi:hypothetical protein